MNKELLSTLGLCKRAGMLEAGEEPVESAARARDVRLLLLAGDAAENTARRADHFAQMGQCILLRVPFTKEDLGRAVGRGSCALLGVTDVGFACAIARRLAEDDPAYCDAAQRLEVKAQRAAQRRTEQALHEKNLRRGKKRRPGEVKAAVPQPEAEKKPSAPRGARPPQRAVRPTEGKKPYSRPAGTEGKKPYGRPAGTEGKKPYGRSAGTEGKKPYGRFAGTEGKKPHSRPAGTEGKKPYSRPADRRTGRFSNSRPVKHGKGSFPKKQG